MKIKAGIIGGAGYTGGELIRILINHQNVEITFVHSTSNAGNPISAVHSDLFGDTDLYFADDLFVQESLNTVDVLFLCAGHGEGRKFLSSKNIDDHIVVIDLSHDFRLSDNSEIENEAGVRKFIYGLPELHRTRIKNTKSIANPGCFATCVQLGLLPFIKHYDGQQIHVQATTGSTGAGQSLSATTHFSWRNNNLSAYKAFEHQHLNEIKENLEWAASKQISQLNFIPLRGDFTRGIFASMYVETHLSIDEIYKIYEDYYANHPFTHVSRKSIDLKQVINTNKCLISLEKHGNQLLILSSIDNLLKGASGQAVQNMNLIFGLEETLGLKLKPVGF